MTNLFDVSHFILEEDFCYGAKYEFADETMNPDDHIKTFNNGTRTPT